MAKHIFISYSKKDKEFAWKLADDLAAAGHKVWIDRSLQVGEDWEHTIEKKLEEAQEVIVVLSSNAIQSKWVQHEGSIAYGGKKPMFPILIEDLPIKDLPLWAEKFQYHNFVGVKYDKAFKELNNVLTPPNPIQEILDNQLATYKEHGTLIDSSLFNVINKNLNSLSITPETQQLLDLSSKRINRAKIIRYVLAILLVVLLVTSGYFIYLSYWRQIENLEQGASFQQTEVFQANEQRNQLSTAVAVANEQTDIAKSRLLAIQALNELDGNLDLSLLLSIEAYRLDDGYLAKNSFFTGVQRAEHIEKFLHIPDGFERFKFSPDGKYLLGINEENEFMILDINAEKVLDQRLKLETPIGNFDFSPDGSFIVVEGCIDYLDEITCIESASYIIDFPSLILGFEPLNIDGDNHVIAISPNGKLIASSGQFRSTITLIDAIKGSVEILSGSSFQHVDKLKFTGNSQKLVSAHRSGYVIWDISEKIPESEHLSGLPFECCHVFNFDATLMAYFYSAGLSGDRFNLVDITGETIIDWSEIDSELSSINRNFKFSVDGNQVIYLDDENNLIVRNARAGYLNDKFYFPFNLKGVNPNGNGYISSEPGDLVFHNMDLTRLNDTLEEIDLNGRDLFDNWTLSERVYYVINGNFVLTYDSNDIYVINLLSKEVTKTISLTEPISTIAISPDYSKFVVGTGNGEIHFYDLVDEYFIQSPIKLHNQTLNALAFTPDGATIASSSADGKLILYNLEKEEIEQILLEKQAHSIKELHFNPQGDVLAAISEEGELIFWNLKDGIPSENVNTLPTQRPTSTTLPTSTATRTSTSTSTPQAESTDNNAGPTSAPVTATVEALMTEAASAQTQAASSILTPTHTPTAWPLSELPEVGQISLLEYSKYTFSPDWQMVAAYSSHKISLITNPNAANETTISIPLNDEMDSIYEVRFSSDGKTLIIIAGDQIYLLDIQTLQLIGAPQDFLFLDREANFDISPDGKTIIAYQVFDGILKFIIDPELWIEHACEIANRNLSIEEWQFYFPDEDYRQTCPNWPVHPSVSE